jgi:hypothetical protein
MKQALIVDSRSIAEPRNFSLIEIIPLSQYDLICILGKDCTAWEEIIDEILVGPTGNQKPLPVTTSHPVDKMAEVLAFASTFFKNEKIKIEHCQI